MTAPVHTIVFEQSGEEIVAKVIDNFYSWSTQQMQVITTASYVR